MANNNHQTIDMGPGGPGPDGAVLTAALNNLSEVNNNNSNSNLATANNGEYGDQSNHPHGIVISGDNDIFTHKVAAADDYANQVLQNRMSESSMDQKPNNDGRPGLTNRNGYSSSENELTHVNPTPTDMRSLDDGYAYAIRKHINLMRCRTDSGNKVTNMELFFDLVYVYAISSISETLYDDLSWENSLKVVLLTFAVWWAWIYSAWITNWLNPDSYFVRLMLIVIMFLSLIMSSILPEAFHERSLLFAGMYCLIQGGRTLTTVLLLHGHALQCNFIRILFWEFWACAFWFAGGFFHGSKTTIILWCIGALIDLCGPVAGFYTPGFSKSYTEDWTIAGGHLAERCQLFIIIALGESIVTTGDSFKHINLFDSAAVGAFTIAFIGAAAMWWIYFHSSADEANEIIEASDDPGAIGRLAYTYIHIIMVLGIIFCAVADRVSIMNPTVIPHRDEKMEFVGVMVAGPALYILGHGIFRAVMKPHVPWAHVVAFILVLCMIPVAIYCALWITALMTTFILLGLGGWESFNRFKTVCREIHYTDG